MNHLKCVLPFILSMFIKVVIDYSKYMGMKYDQDSILAFIKEGNHVKRKLKVLTVTLLSPLNLLPSFQMSFK